MNNLKTKIKLLGEKFPKKHGEWYRLKIYDDNYLLLDTWNGQVCHHKGCESSGTDNMYRCVYVFGGFVNVVKGHMVNFWKCHIK